MKFGTHVSAAGGMDNTFERAKNVGAEVFQCFSRPPQGGPAPELTPDLVARFVAAREKTGITDYYIHTPYFINLASVEAKNRKFSAVVILDELKRGSLLGFKYVNTHIGSAGEGTTADGIKRVVEGLKDILKKHTGSTGLLIEISAGSGQIIGDTFEEIAEILDAADKDFPGQLNVCFDTAHAFASGYDLRTPADVKATIDRFDAIVGLDRLKLIHGNDSKVGLGERKDRHEHIGKGKIGLEGFKAFVNEPRLQGLSFILETPKDDPEDDLRNLAILRKMYKRK